MNFVYFVCFAVHVDFISHSFQFIFDRLNFKFILIFRIYLNHQASFTEHARAVVDSIRDIHRTDILKLKS